MPEAKVASSKVVAYIGTSDVRSISVADWDASNIKGQDRVWSSHNGWQIPVDNFGDDEMAYFATDTDFVVKDAVIPDIQA